MKAHSRAAYRESESPGRWSRPGVGAAAWLMMLLVACDGGGGKGPETATVAAASSLSQAAEELRLTFERETGKRLALTFGSSGQLVAQIQNGAPFDLLLAADVDYPQAVVRSGLADPESFVVYARGRLVVWVPPLSSVALESEGMQALGRAGVGRIALANPEVAPYGRAALQALRNLNLLDRLQNRLIFAESVSQALQIAELGGADAGFVALSLVRSLPSHRQGRFLEVPAAACDPIDHAAVMLTSARQRGQEATARAFLSWLTGEKGQALLARLGFDPPAGPAPAGEIGP